MLNEVKDFIKKGCTVTTSGETRWKSPRSISDGTLDKLVRMAVFDDAPEGRDLARWAVRQLAVTAGITPSSIQSLYSAFGRMDQTIFTIPAINIRTMTYDFSRAMFRTGKKLATNAFVFEIAKSEIAYTAQSPAEYSACILGAAMREGYNGPVFIQGDHVQFNLKKWKADPKAEMESIKTLVKEQIDAGFYNIDIDASTLVDLTPKTVEEQQKANIDCTVEMIRFIRKNSPLDVEISIGGEIGEVGGKNSTVEEFVAFADGLRAAFNDTPIRGISKVSIQTGTTHGGTPAADGSVVEVAIDFPAHKAISAAARDDYRIGGTVQHGASTLPEEMFDKFPRHGCIEIHLATGFQNLIYDFLPKALRDEMYAWVRKNCADEFKKDQTEEQNLYKARKKAWGPFKKALWDLDPKYMGIILKALEDRFSSNFTKLGADGMRQAVADHVKVMPVRLAAPPILREG